MAGDNTILTIIQNYFGYSIIGIAFVLSVVYCLITKTKYKRVLLVGLLLVIVFVLNDFSRTVIETIGEKKTYYRFLWIIPVTPIIAYALTEIISSCKKKNDKIIVLFGLISILLINGISVMPVRETLLPVNKYNIAGEVVEISRIIEEDYGETGETPAECMQKKRVAVPYDLELQLRSYDASLSYGISRKAYIYINENGLYTNKKKYNTEEYVVRAIVCGMQEDVQKLRKCIDKLEIKYLVTHTTFGMDAYLAEIDCYPIGYTGTYVIYRVE